MMKSSVLKHKKTSDGKGKFIENPDNRVKAYEQRV